MCCVDLETLKILLNVSILLFMCFLGLGLYLKILRLKRFFEFVYIYIYTATLKFGLYHFNEIKLNLQRLGVIELAYIFS